MRRVAPRICRRWATTTNLFCFGAFARFSTTPFRLDQLPNLTQQSERGGFPPSRSGAADEHHSSFDGSQNGEQSPPSPPSVAAKGPLDEKKDISVTGADGAEATVHPLSSFADLKGLPQWLENGVLNLGFTTPSVIQQFTIPALQGGHDIIGLAPTGSGKTVAFAIPALQHLGLTQMNSPAVLVLAPTRELVQQTTKVFEKLAKGHVRIAEAYGGSPREIQARRLHRGCDVLVACPGRLKDFLDAGDVTLSHLSFLVFDEADRLLDMGFQSQLDDILAFVEPTQHVQRMMWSATWPAAVQDLARSYLSPQRLLIRAGTAGTGAQVNEHINQRVIFVEGFQHRVEKLVELIDSGEIDDKTAKLIIFVGRQSETEEVAHALSRRLSVDARYVGVLHGGLSQRRRDLVMSDFKSNRIRLLVATDVASRGLDIPDVTCVINFHAPQNIDSYCHRIGRTGRAGRSGDAYTFIGRQDGALAAKLIDYLRRCKMDVPSDLAQLEARHIADSRSGPRTSRGRGGGGFNRYNNSNRSRSSGGGSGNRWARPHQSGGRRHTSDGSDNRSPARGREYTSRSGGTDDNGWM